MIIFLDSILPVIVMVHVHVFVLAGTNVVGLSIFIAAFAAAVVPASDATTPMDVRALRYAR